MQHEAGNLVGPLLGGRTVCAPQAPPDLLSEVLHDLRLGHASYGRSELTAPFGIEIPFKGGVRFHFVAEGACWILSAGQDAIRLEAGDVVLLPHGTGHVMADDPGRRPRPLEAFSPELVGAESYRLTAGGGGARSLIVCCTIGFEGPTAHPLLELLPPALIVRRAKVSDPALPVLLDMMAREVTTPRIGSATIMARLADIVMSSIVRTWLEQQPTDLTGWLAAVRDPQVGLALARMHREPGQAWSVESLAAVAGMSRSKFSERFGQLLTVSPARYLLLWRMRLAAAWLRTGSMTVAQAAARLGYESDAAFSRAFKRVTGLSPGSARLLPV
ncbi:MAG: AraC family transcriptional regulator [Phenylobacterium sp.]|uniref:AraC family transcriptional regulator n=1 Tax=Phenylobacterium sp. TaxID=1871053 RepID=UPI0027368F06|nr:AraC family transcriptional regulator [Phenylobacterium sp.]MDP3748199.1 AraC family transcriptional regulator [Phenylobacterium sp.]